MKKIRLTRVAVGEYAPDLDESFYVDNNITTIEAAAAIDLKSLEKGEISLEELTISTVSYGYEIVEVDDDNS